MSAAKLTKAELLSQLEASHVAYQQLSTLCESLQAEVHEMRLLHLAVKLDKPLPAPRAPVATSSWRVAAAKARDLAITTGRCVRVG